MVTIGAFTAKTHLSKLLSRVEKGETVQITRRGVPIAQIVPVEGAPSQNLRKVVQEIRELRRGFSLKGLSIRKLRDEGRP